ncbi:hypothetical protein BRD56_02435 [Thermoplasmatales archaeon SW_10_69_26]|nr:MAG: hypothetical protein BRD56_02435 [Thermoplasmatales archaeon SW_10_69_26]
MAPTAPASLAPTAEPDADTDLDWEPAPTPSGAPARDVGGSGEALVVSTWREGTLRSTDGGHSFSPVDTRGVEEGEVVFDPNDPERGYLAGFGGLARTTDAGETWELSLETERSRVVDIHPDGTVAASIRAEDTFDSQTFLVSEDGGDTWTEIPKPYEGSTSLQGLAFGPTSQDIVVAGLTESWVTDDRGQTWTHQDQGARWLASETDGTIWRAGMGETIPSGDGTWEEHPERSTDGGQTWEAVPFDHVPRELAPHPEGGLYVATSQGIHVTTDDGDTWTDMGADTVAWLATGMVADPANPDAVFFTDEQIGLNHVEPTDDGYVYEGRTQGFPPVAVDTLATAPTTDVVLAGGQQGLYANDGTGWTHAGAGLGISTVDAAAATDTGRLYAGGSNGIYQPYVQVGHLDDSDWSKHILETNDGHVTDLTVHPDDPETAWAAVAVDLAPSKVYETTDGGETWEPIFTAGADTPPSVSNVNVGMNEVTYDDAQDRLVVATGNGVYVQTGDTWTPRLTGTDGARAVATNGNITLAGGQGADLWRAHTDETVFAPWAEAGARVDELELAPSGERAWALAGGTVQACHPEAPLQGDCTRDTPPVDATAISHVTAAETLWATTPHDGLYRAATN